MAKLLTVDSITSRDLKGFRKETQELIKVALASGWTGLASTRGSLTLRGAVGDGVIHLSKNSRNNSGPLQQFYDKIIKYGDPVQVAAIQGAWDSKVEMPDPEFTGNWKLDIADIQAKEVLKNLPPHLAIPLRRFSLKDMDEGIAALKARSFLGTPAETVGALIDWYKEKQEAEKVAKQPAATVEATKPHVVSVHPYLSHKNKGTDTRPGKSYESKSVLERTWSDGTKDYQCAFKDYDGPTPAHITSHWRRHTNAGEVEVVGNWYTAGAQLVEDPSYTEHAYTRETSPAVIEATDYNPREDRVQALAAELLKALKENWQGQSMEELAEAVARSALTWVHDQQGNGVPREPETAEELLAKIRDLVDRGEYARMRQAALEAEQTADQALERAERAETREAKLKSDLRTLRELLSSVDGEDE